MWLPADERNLLAGLYRSIGKVGGEFAFRQDSLAELLHGEVQAPEYGEEPDEPQVNRNCEQLKLAIKEVCCNRKRIENALALLSARSLISFERHSSEISVVIVGLTLIGFDLGRQYSSWLTRSHLWWREHKDHWAWVVTAYLGGVVSTLLVQFLRHAFLPESR